MAAVVRYALPCQTGITSGTKVALTALWSDEELPRGTGAVSRKSGLFTIPDAVPGGCGRGDKVVAPRARKA